MDLSRIYTKTSRGILDGALKTRALSREHGRIFALIDGKASLEDLLAQNTRLSQNHLAAIIDQLVSAGLIRLVDEVAAVDDLGFSSTIIVSEANTQAFFDAQIAADIKARLAEVEESLAHDKAREALLQEVTADIAAEAEALKRQAQSEPLAKQANTSTDQHAPENQSAPNSAAPKQAQSRAEIEAQAKAELAASNARMAKQKISVQDQHEALIKAREELDRAAREEAKAKAEIASRIEKAITREAKSTIDRESKPTKDRQLRAAAEQERRELEAKIIAEEEAQRNAELDAHFLAIEGSIPPATKSEPGAPKIPDQSRLAAELDARVKRRLEARAREEAEAAAKAQAEEAARVKAAEEAKHQAEAEAAAAKLEAERKARLEAEQKAQAEAEARAQAEAAAKAQAEEAARVKAAEEAKRQAEAEAAAAKLEAERKARLEAEQKAQAEAEARAQAEAAAKAQAEEAARVKAAEEAKRQAEAEAAAAKLEAERKARLEAEQKAQAEAEARARAEAAAKAQAEEAARVKAAEDEVKLQAAATAKLEAEANALVAEAEEAVRQEAAAAKREMEQQQREEDARLAGAIAEQEVEAELQAQALAEKTAQALADERTQMELEALAREQAQVLAREEANAKARAEMEEALRREQDKLTQEQKEEARLREEAQARAMAAAQSANLPIFNHRKRKPLRYNPSWNKPIAQSILGILILGVALAHLLPFNFYIPKLERQLSDSLGQQVKIETLRFSVYPAPHLALEGVVVGDQVGVGARMDKASLFPALTSWFSDVKLIRRVELESFTLSAESPDAFPLWSRQQARTVPFQFERLLVKNGKFKHPLLEGYTFDAEMEARRGKFLQAKVITSDQRITLNVVPQADALRIDLQAKQSKWPFEPQLTLESLKLTALAQGGNLEISNIEAQLFDGYATGSAQVNWSKAWSYTAELKLLQIAMAPSLAHFTREANVTGTLEAKVRLAAQADSLDALFGASQVQATYRVKNGEYTGIDLVRAIQAPRRGGHIGGKTNFDDLSGFFQYSKGRAQFRQIKLQGGVVSASGNLEINQDNAMAGNLTAELRTPSAQFRSSFTVAGTLETPVLKPFVPRAVSPAEKSEAAAETSPATGVTQPEN